MEEKCSEKSKGTSPSNVLSFAQLSAYLSVGFITFMVLIHSNKTLIAKQKQGMITPANLQVNYIYDPDHGLNISHVCLSGENVHKTKYKDSPCVNKTFIGWYNPWARHHFWKKLWKEKDEKRRERREMEIEKATEEEAGRKETDTENEEMIETTEKAEESPEPSTEDSEKNQKKEKGKRSLKKKESDIEMLYAILIGLLLMSALATCWEVVKGQIQKNHAAEKKAQEDRECALANFTINRHLRRESQQQTSSSLPRQGSLEQRSKVTKSFIHQSSLDRTSPVTNSEALNPRTDRRYSVPAALLGDDITANKVTTVLSPLIRVERLSSIDVTPEDINLDARKKPRHFIRRY